MYILTVLGHEKEGVYAVETESGEMILYVFTEEDDAVRYAMLLEENDGYPEMHVIELDDELILQTCETGGYKYALITEDDIVFPPKDCPLGTIE
jgi:hypothetical protein